MDLKEWWRIHKKLTKEGDELHRLPLHINELIKDVVHEAREFGTQRDALHKSLRRKLMLMKEELGAVRQHITDSKERGTIDPKKMQTILENFEGKLTAATVTFRNDIEQYNAQSEGLTQELFSFDSKISSWLEAEVSANPSHRGHDVADDEDEEQYIQKRRANMERFKRDLDRQRRIGAIDKQISGMGGRCGGWDARDHDVFVRVWTQVGLPTSAPTMPIKPLQVNGWVGTTDDTDSIPAGGESGTTPDGETTGTHVFEPPAEAVRVFLRKVSSLLPGQDQLEIEEHIQWFVQLMNLNAEKKRILSAWKDEKYNHHKSDEAVDEEFTPDDVADESIDGSNSRRGSAVTAVLSKEAERAAVKARLQKWREQKELEASLRKEEAKREEARQKKLVEDKKRQYNQVTRAKLDEWKQEEQQQKEALLLAENTANARRASSADPAEIRRRKQRDLQVAHERHERVERHQQELQPRAVKIQAISVTPVASATRDSDRVRGLTAAAKAGRLDKEQLDFSEHKRATSAAHSRPIALSGRDLHFGVRSRPTWASKVM